MTSSAINAILAPWFVRKRGVALSLALTGASFGGIAFVPLAERTVIGVRARDAQDAVHSAALQLPWSRGL